jgi:hypothetical protein
MKEKPYGLIIQYMCSVVIDFLCIFLSGHKTQKKQKMTEFEASQKQRYIERQIVKVMVQKSRWLLQAICIFTKKGHYVILTHNRRWVCQTL